MRRWGLREVMRVGRSHEGGVSINGIPVLLGVQRELAPSQRPSCEGTARSLQSVAQKSPPTPPNTALCWLPDLGLAASRTVRNTCLFLSHTVNGIFVKDTPSRTASHEMGPKKNGEVNIRGYQVSPLLGLPGILSEHIPTLPTQPPSNCLPRGAEAMAGWIGRDRPCTWVVSLGSHSLTPQTLTQASL